LQEFHINLGRIWRTYAIVACPTCVCNGYRSQKGSMTHCTAAVRYVHVHNCFSHLAITYVQGCPEPQKSYTVVYDIFSFFSKFLVCLWNTVHTYYYGLYAAVYIHIQASHIRSWPILQLCFDLCSFHLRNICGHLNNILRASATQHLGGVEHKTLSFPIPCRWCLHYLRCLQYLRCIHYLLLFLLRDAATQPPSSVTD